MAQTAMQELLDDIEKYIVADWPVNKSIRDSINRSLEKEKEQIENAMRVSYKKGWADAFEFIKEIKTKQNENSND